MVKAFGGSIGKAVLQKNDKEKYLQIEKIVDNSDKIDLIDFLNNSKFIYDKENIYKIIDYMIIYIYEKSKKEKKYINCIEIINKCQDRLRKNCNFDMCIDTMLIDIWKELR